MKISITTLLLIFCLQTNASESDVVRVFVSWPGYNYAPIYSWDEENKTFTGIDPEIIALLLKSAKIKYKFVSPITRTHQPRIEVLEKDMADISIRSFSITEARKERIDFTTPYFSDGLSFIVRKDSSIKKQADLKDKSILAYINTTGYVYLTKSNLTQSIFTDIPEEYM